MLVLACCCQSALAQQSKPEKEQREDTPSLALLEFLAEMHSVDGQWVSPVDMLNQPLSEQAPEPQEGQISDKNEATGSQLKGQCLEKVTCDEKAHEKVKQ